MSTGPRHDLRHSLALGGAACMAYATASWLRQCSKQPPSMHPFPPSTSLWLTSLLPDSPKPRRVHHSPSAAGRRGLVFFATTPPAAAPQMQETLIDVEDYQYRQASAAPAQSQSQPSWLPHEQPWQEQENMAHVQQLLARPTERRRARSVSDTTDARYAYAQVYEQIQCPRTPWFLVSRGVAKRDAEDPRVAQCSRRSCLRVYGERHTATNWLVRRCHPIASAHP